MPRNGGVGGGGGESSSDEDDDLQVLVPQSHIGHQSKPSPFEVTSNLTRKISSHKKYYLILLSFAVIVTFLYFSINRRFFGQISAYRSQSPSDLMRESELKALFLLKSQQTLLLEFWNRSSTKNDSALNVDEFRLGFLDLIKKNQQIQQAILSSHRPKNSNVSMDSADGFDYTNYNKMGVCKKVERGNQRKTIEWKPRSNKFLFAICFSGQMSNHLICLEKHMFMAALLGRILVFPSHKLDYKYDEVLDLDHINKCFGRKVAVSYDEFNEMKKNKLKIDRLICYVASPPCYLDEEHIKRLKNEGISLGKIEAAWPEDVKLKVQKKRVVNDIIEKFSSEDEVIAIGDMFYADLEEEWVMQPGGPLAHKCKTLIQPSRLIILTAQRFVQTFLGKNFAALHFRRHGFLKFCNVKEESCFFPIPQAAECIIRVVEKSNAAVIYLSTDAADSETDLLQSLLVPNIGKPIILVKRPAHNPVEKWDALLYRNKLGSNLQVEAMLDKTISAMSNVFIGASGSTFTEDIFRLRRGWGTASRCDEYLCKGEQPDFIADNE